MNNLFSFKAISESSWVFGGQFGAVLGQLILLKISTNFLSVSDYGIFMLFLVCALLIERTVMTIQAGIIRYYCEAFETSELNVYWFVSKSLLIKHSKVTLSLGLLLGLYLAFFGNLEYIPYAVIFTGFSIALGWNTALLGLQLAARQRKIHALFQILEPFLRLTFFFLLIRLSVTPLLSISLAYLASAGFMLYFLFAKTYNSLFGDYSSNFSDQAEINPARYDDWQSKIWKFSWPISAWGILSWLQQSSDKFALDTQVGNDSVAFYSVLFQLGFMPMILIAGSFNNIVTPILYKRLSLSADLNQEVKRKLNIVNISIALLTMLTLASFLIGLNFGDLLMNIAVSSQYLEYSYLLPLMILAGGITSIAQMLGVQLLALKRTKLLLVGNIIYAIIALVLNYSLAFALGLPGVVLAVLITSIAYLILLFSLSNISSLESI